MTAVPGTSAPGAGAGRTGATRIREFRLPDLGEGLTESEIVRWHVAEGDTVELNQVIADVETAKAVVELPSPYAGVVVRLHEAAGTVVDVGVPIVSFEVAAEPDGDTPAQARASASPPARPPVRSSAVPPVTASVTAPARAESPGRREPNLVGYGAAVEKSGRPQRRSRTLLSVPRTDRAPAAHAADPVPPPASLVAPPASPAGMSPPAASTGARQGNERPRSTPPVRKLARDLGIPLDTLTGTGPGALITRDDVLAALPGATASPAAPTGTDPVAASGGAAEAHGGAPATGSGGTAEAHTGGTARETRTPIRGMRKHTAAAMVASAFTAPHVTEFLTVDVTPTVDLLADLRADPAFGGTKVTPLTIAAKAACIAIARNPTLNSSWDEEAQEIVQYADVNLGIAAATPRGLLVPNIKAAQALPLVDLARAIGSLTEAARSGRTPPSDLAGGTVSITNIGVFGIDAGTPILNPGEAAILALGAVRSMPWEYRGAIALRSVLTLSLSFDHRVVDGEQGSRFLADVGTILRDPAMALTMI